MEGRTDPQDQHIESAPGHHFFGQPLRTAEIAGMKRVRRPHRDDDGPDSTSRLADRGSVIGRGGDHAGVNRVGEVRQLNVGERGDQTAAIMQIADDHFRAEPGEGLGALEPAGQDSN